jgi:hypothetical protein
LTVKVKVICCAETAATCLCRFLVWLIDRKGVGDMLFRNGGNLLMQVSGLSL